MARPAASFPGGRRSAVGLSDAAVKIVSSGLTPGDPHTQTGAGETVPRGDAGEPPGRRCLPRRGA